VANTRSVKTVDGGEYVLQLSAKHDFLGVKVDIEGAEWMLLRHLLLLHGPNARPLAAAQRPPGAHQVTRARLKARGCSADPEEVEAQTVRCYQKAVQPP